MTGPKASNDNFRRAAANSNTPRTSVPSFRAPAGLKQIAKAARFIPHVRRALELYELIQGLTGQFANGPKQLPAGWSIVRECNGGDDEHFSFGQGRCWNGLELFWSWAPDGTFPGGDLVAGVRSTRTPNDATSGYGLQTREYFRSAGSEPFAMSPSTLQLPDTQSVSNPLNWFDPLKAPLPGTRAIPFEVIPQFGRSLDPNRAPSEQRVAGYTAPGTPNLPARDPWVRPDSWAEAGPTFTWESFANGQIVRRMSPDSHHPMPPEGGVKEKKIKIALPHTIVRAFIEFMFEARDALNAFWLVLPTSVKQASKKKTGAKSGGVFVPKVDIHGNVIRKKNGKIQYEKIGSTHQGQAVPASQKLADVMQAFANGYMFEQHEFKRHDGAATLNQFGFNFDLESVTRTPFEEALLNVVENEAQDLAFGLLGQQMTRANVAAYRTGAARRANWQMGPAL